MERCFSRWQDPDSKPFTASQKVRFDGFKDPESVFCVDWREVADWQQFAFLEKAG